jgi:diguanylate cyclase (GGDEF)-like protein/PAS domain S-box-containing protein
MRKRNVGKPGPPPIAPAGAEAAGVGRAELTDATASPSERRYKALVQASTSVVWRAAPDGAIIEAWGWNAFADQPQLAYLGNGWLEALHPDDRDRTRQHWAEAVSKGELAAMEYRVRQPDGSYRWAMARAIALRDDAGAIAEWVGTVTDIQERKFSEQMMREREELLRLAVEATGLGIWDMELPSRSTEWSAKLKAMAGLSPDAAIDDAVFYGLVHPDDQNEVEAKITEAVGSLNLAPYNIVYRLRRADTQEERWWHEWSRLVMDASGKPARLVGAIQDITQRKRAEIERHNSEKRWRLALKAGRMAAWERTIETGVTTWSDNAGELLGLAAGQVAEFTGRVHRLDQKRLLAAINNPGHDGHAVEFRYLHPDGRELWLETSAMLIESDGGPRRVVGVTSDITERKASETRLRHAANHDALTGLPNRAALQVAIERAIARGRKAGRRVALVLVDLDHFKDINDTLGHDAGDHLLRAAGDRLKSAVGDLGLVARLGGDEFAVLVEETPCGPEPLATSLLDELRKGFSHAGKWLSISASIGIATFPDQASRSIELLKHADLALYSAKNGGRSRVQTYAPRMRQALEQRISLANEVKQALARAEIVPFYQPKIDLLTGEVGGFEALARWLHPTRGVLTPGVFGGVFEDGELSIAIGDVMLARMMEDMSVWLSRGLDVGRVALNLSSFAFMLPDLADQLLGQLAAAAIPTSSFEIEVTETVLLDGEARGVSATLERLHERGIKISLDDFGTGYASLTHLKRFPVDELKIDRSFIRNLESDQGDAAIVAAVVSLARSLGLKVVAEGVETQGQVAKLRSSGCHFGQGYLFAKPMTASRVPWFLREAGERFGHSPQRLRASSGQVGSF